MRLHISIASVLLVVVFATGVNRAEACDCDPGRPFLEASIPAHTIVLGKVLRYSDEKNSGDTPLYMVVEVTERLKGSDTSCQIVVWGDPGRLCRPYVTQFPLGANYLFILDTIHPKERKGEVKEYFISNCDETWLSVTGAPEMVMGRITSKQDRAALEVVRRSVLNRSKSLSK